MQTPRPQKTLIILAISSRIYLEAAVAAGFAVIVIDAFIDSDTKRLATKSYQVDVTAGQLNATQVLRILATLDLSEVIGLCYGAGLESQIDLLIQLEKEWPVCGNLASAVKRCKAPDKLFPACKTLGISTPETCLTLPENPSGWLQKMIGGSGGAHIVAAGRLTKADMAKNKGVYYQRLQAGISFSCLFLANIDFVQIIGFNEQWVDKNGPGGFCYGGAVSQAVIDRQVKDKAIVYIKKICQAFELKGLNSCDFIYSQGAVYLLEVNPRLSASLDLYEDQQGILMQAHVDIFKRDLKATVPLSLTRSKAHQIVYALTEILINQTQFWPTWVSDIPAANTRINKGGPICTVNAVAANALAARKLLEKRIATLNF